MEKSLRRLVFKFFGSKEVKQSINDILEHFRTRPPRIWYNAIKRGMKIKSKVVFTCRLQI